MDNAMNRYVLVVNTNALSSSLHIFSYVHVYKTGIIPVTDSLKKKYMYSQNYIREIVLKETQILSEKPLVVLML